ncbi:hypothetical protein [Actinosynnema sp. NPDC020468]|uniref:HalD/BesD family halogenase n=1 Tax=Actinosynnema sp. NPDC020468 TaxID=3154488 RepID=UPI0033D5FCF4
MTADAGLSRSNAVSAADVNDLMTRHIDRAFGPDAVAELRVRFEQEHIVPLRGLCPPEMFEQIKDEACDIIDRHGTTHDLTFEITDNTPRNMTTVGQPIIKDEGPLIDAFYFAPVLLDFVGKVVGEQVHTCPYAGEHYVISRLGRSGDTHGWHWDDYTYGIILVLEAPHYTQGGFVQAVPNTSWDKQNPDVYGALISSQVRSYALEPGDAYVVKTNTTMHRVHPIRGDGRRTIVNMTLASTADLQAELTHETNDTLFGGVRDTRVGK